MRRFLSRGLPLTSLLVLGLVVACGESSSSSGGVIEADSGSFDASTTDSAIADSSTAADAADASAAVDADADAAKVLPSGLLGPIAYVSRADSPFNGVAFGSYSHFEDWEDSALNTPGVTANPDTLSSSFGASLIDSVDGDDGVVDGKCVKAVGSCNAAFGNGTITFTFDATVLGALPTHVGIVWTDGSPSSDAIFEAYDDADVLIGTRTAATLGNADNNGTTDEDRFFGVVHPAGVKKVVIKSSSGGVEADHLSYGR